MASNGAVEAIEQLAGVVVPRRHALGYANREGGGSLFTLRLPAADLDESPEQETA